MVDARDSTHPRGKIALQDHEIPIRQTAIQQIAGFEWNEHIERALVQLRGLRTWTIRDRNRPHLVLGDFNAMPGSVTYGLLRQGAELPARRHRSRGPSALVRLPRPALPGDESHDGRWSR